MGKIDFKNKKVLITGGNGFLASHLIPALLELGAQVVSFDMSTDESRSNIQSFPIDLNDQESLSDFISEIQPDIVYHLAASLNRTRDFTVVNEVLKTNLNGTNNLLIALSATAYQKFIFVSTSEVYGGDMVKAPFKENSDFVPASPYSLSKYCAEKAVQTFSEIYGKSFTVLRLFNFFGKGMGQQFFIPQLIETLKNNKEFNMTKGEQIRDFLYIKDVVQAMLMANSEKANKKVFNVCSGQGKSIKEIALDIKNEVHSESKINFGALEYRDNEVWNMVGDNTLLRTTLGWEPKFTFKEGLKEYLS